MKKFKIKDRVGFIAGIVMFIACFMPCWKMFGLSAAIIDGKGGLWVLIMALAAIAASVPGSWIVQVIAGAFPLLYLFIQRIAFREVSFLFSTGFGMWLIILSAIVLVASGLINRPKKKK